MAIARRNPAATVALACLAGLVLTGALAYHWPQAQAWDRDLLHRFVSIDHDRIRSTLGRLTTIADELAVMAMALGLVVVALIRGRYRLAALVPVILAGSVGTTQALKHLLADPRPVDWLGAQQIDAASWPSGHATGSLALALCAVLVAPRGLRPLAALVGAAFALVVSGSTLVLHGHFPSDVLGGWLCAGMWAAAAVALAHPIDVRSEAGPSRRTRLLAAAMVFGLAAFLLAVVVATDRPGQLAGQLADRTAFSVCLIAGMAVTAAWSGWLAREERAEPDQAPG